MGLVRNPSTTGEGGAGQITLCTKYVVSERIWEYCLPKLRCSEIASVSQGVELFREREKERECVCVCARACMHVYVCICIGRSEKVLHQTLLTQRNISYLPNDYVTEVVVQ